MARPRSSGGGGGAPLLRLLAAAAAIGCALAGSVSISEVTLLLPPQGAVPNARLRSKQG